MEALTVIVDSRNEPELTLEILKQAAMTCPSILEHPAPSAAATEFKADRITYEIYFSTSFDCVGGRGAIAIDYSALQTSTPGCR